MIEIPGQLITVVVVDDHGLIREGTHQLLEQDELIHVVAETGDGREAIRLAVELRPSVMLVDVQLDGDVDGIAVVRSVTDRRPQTKCLVLSGYDDSVYVSEALAAGACGYLLKSAGANALIAAVRTAHGGAMVIDDRVSQRMRWGGRPEPAQAEHLTPREVDVLRLLARGHSNKQIAGQLGLGTRTVEGHVSNILAKCDVRTRSQAILYAMAHRLVSPGRGDGGC